MKFEDKLDIILSETEMVGNYAIQTDHPGLMKSLKKKKTTKKDRSIFMRDKDAEKQYIKGKINTDGSTSKIDEKVSNRLESLNV